MSDIFFTCSKWGAANTDKYRRIPESNYPERFIALQLKTKIPALCERELFSHSKPELDYTARLFLFTMDLQPPLLNKPCAGLSRNSRAYSRYGYC